MVLILGLCTPAGGMKSTMERYRETEKFLVEGEHQGTDFRKFFSLLRIPVGNTTYLFEYNTTALLKDTYFDVISNFSVPQDPSTLLLFVIGQELRFTEVFQMAGDKMLFRLSEFLATSYGTNDVNRREQSGLRHTSHSRGENHRSKLVSRTIAGDPAVEYVLTKIGGVDSFPKFYPVVFIRTWRLHMNLRPTESSRATYPNYKLFIDELECYGLMGTRKVTAVTTLEITTEPNNPADPVNNQWLRQINMYLSSLLGDRARSIQRPKLHDILEKTVF
jgi:hypothetical protein